MRLSLLSASGSLLLPYVDKAFEGLKADIKLTSPVSMGAYNTSLEYTQLLVPIKNDSSVNFLLPVLARPMI